ncbi:MAG TPA: hypothetical protein VGG74_09065 [Kofleriaceae bacterium]|jgi:hypothetical protein
MWGLVIFAVVIPVGLLLAKVRDRRRDAARAQHDKDDLQFMLSTPRLRARIFNSEQFGMTNLKPSFRLVLRIEGPDGAYPVETDQYVDFADVQRMRVGKMVDVQFDTKKRDRVLLCGSDIETADAPFDDRSEAKFLAAGVRVPAKILSVAPIPQVSVTMPGLPGYLWLSLHIEASSGAYDSGTCVPSVGIRALAVGDAIHVWIEPNNHDRLELDVSDLAAPK